MENGLVVGRETLLVHGDPPGEDIRNATVWATARTV